VDPTNKTTKRDQKMKSAPDEILCRFAHHLSCEYSADYGINPCYTGAATTLSLPHLLSSLDEERVRCTFPCLAIGPSSRHSRTVRRMGEQPLGMGIGMGVDDERLGNDIYDESITAIARDLRRTMRMGKRAVPLAPSMLLRNVLRSFGAMLERRLRRTVFKLAERSAIATTTKFCDVNADTYRETLLERERITAALRALSLSGQGRDSETSLDFSSSPSWSLLTPTAAYTEFSIEDNNTIDDYWEVEQDGAEVILPLRFMAHVDVHVLDGREVSVTFGAPGTITGVFASGRNRPDSVSVDIDTTILLREMKRRCRELVKMAVSIACEGTPCINAIVDDLDSVSSVSSSSFGSISPDRVSCSPYSRLSRKTRNSISKSFIRNSSLFSDIPSKKRKHLQSLSVLE